MELPFGSQFEESVFEGGRRELKGCASLSHAYRARFCEPEWFCEEAVGEDDAESVNIKKFRGDLAYKQREFKGAIQTNLHHWCNCWCNCVGFHKDAIKRICGTRRVSGCSKHALQHLCDTLRSYTSSYTSSKALFEYSGLLVLLAPSNIAMRRDVQESQARCLAHLGRYQEALEIAEMLRNGATNTDHVTVVLGLQFAIYRTLENIEKMIECLQKLIMVHPFHPENWKLLAEAYMSRLRLPAPLSVSEADFQRCESININNRLQVSSSDAGFRHCKNHNWRKDISLQCSSKATGPCEECQTVAGSTSTIEKLEVQQAVRSATFSSLRQEHSEDSWIYACGSFIRARLLLQLVQSQQSSFALESNLKAQQEIEDTVASFGLQGDVLFLMTEAMGEDLVPENLKEDAQGEVKCISAPALTSLMTASATEFERKWFQKLRDGLSHLHCTT